MEKEEIFTDAVIREVHEETGLTIENPLFCGVYHWNKSGTHHVIFLYKEIIAKPQGKDSKEKGVELA